MEKPVGEVKDERVGVGRETIQISMQESYLIKEREKEGFSRKSL